MAYFSGAPLQTFTNQSMNSTVSGDNNVVAGRSKCCGKVQPVGKRVHERGRSFQIYQQDVIGKAYNEQMTQAAGVISNCTGYASFGWPAGDRMPLHRDRFPFEMLRS